ncbi:ATPase OSCP/delta subunit [Arabidopsis thaliana x Arabidopsis arenosa]|uniref:Oligomycin sensitivity conferral protein n=1 Tax=Arabidopsis thaliana x Arabidopsis arenosa TaxID=1240361 RepID=A0A8T1YWN1_9BRAS|nr:ATPase OSCP/delta subunit [Arabidopsis thaliana x Arabidopsis arenosa]
MALANRFRSGISFFKNVAVADSVSSVRSNPHGGSLFPALRNYATASAQTTANVKVPIALVGENGNFASWLYIAAVKMNSLEKIESDLSEMIEAMKTAPIFAQFTKDPSVPRGTRLAAIRDACDQAKFAEPTKNFLSLLAENGKLKNLDAIVKKFMQLTNAHRGDVKVLVTTVMPLPPAEEKELTETLQEIIGAGKKITVEQKIDPSIYGGLIVEFQQKVLDMSIRTRAQQMERLLREPVDFNNL